MTMPPVSCDTSGTKMQRIRAAYIVALFFVCYVFAYVDRQILTVLVQPVRSSLGLSDTEIGVLQGFAFAIFYSVGGLPVAWLVDRANRMRVVAGCVFIWTAATVLSGFSTTFTQLLITRGGTAAAESGLVPAGFSVFADTLTPLRVPRASAILMLAPFIGGGMALLAGGAALAHFSVAGTHSWLFQKLLPWQMVYVVIGLPGIVLVTLLLMVREPVRTELGTMRDVGAEPAPTPRQVCKFLFSDSQFFAPYIAGMCIILLLFYSQLAWFPALLSRQFDAPAASVGKLLGPVFMLAGITGTLASQLFLRRLANDSVVPRIVSVITGAIGAQVLLALAIPLLPDLRAGVALYGVSTFLTSIITSIMNVPLQLSVPNRMRGQTIGIAVFGASLFGTGAGPFLVGFLNDHAFSGRASLGLSLAVVAGAAATTATVLMFRARTVYGRPRRLGDAMKAGSRI